MISWQWDDTDGWNSFSWKTRTRLSNIINNTQLMTLWLKTPGHQQPWYWSSYLEKYQTQHQKGSLIARFMGPTCCPHELCYLGWLIQSYVDQSHNLSCGESNKYITKSLSMESPANKILMKNYFDSTHQGLMIFMCDPTGSRSQVMACHLFDVKPWTAEMLIYWQLDLQKKLHQNFN